MKKLLLQTVMLLMSIAVFAQTDPDYQKGYDFGRKYGLVIIVALLVIIVLIVVRVVNKRKNRPKP